MINSIYKALIDNNENLAKVIEGLTGKTDPIQYDYRSYIGISHDSNNKYLTYRQLLELDFENDIYKLTLEVFEYDEKVSHASINIQAKSLSYFIGKINIEFNYPDERYKRPILYNYDLYLNNANNLLAQIKYFQNEVNKI